MSLFLPFKRATLLVPSGSDQSKHIYVLLTDPIDSDEFGKNQVLMVSLSSSKPNIPYHDPTCILQIGDHRFIRHESFIFYKMARIEDANKLLRGVESGVFLPRDQMTQEVFDRITQGLYQTEYLSPKYLRFYEQSLNV